MINEKNTRIVLLIFSATQNFVGTRELLFGRIISIYNKELVSSLPLRIIRIKYTFERAAGFPPRAFIRLRSPYVFGEVSECR